MAKKIDGSKLRISLEEQIDEYVDDPRRDHGQIYPLKTIIVLAVIAAIGNANDWVAVERFCKGKEEWLKQLMPNLAKIPSHDTFRRVFVLLDPDAWQACFQAWMRGFGETQGAMLALDGKALRGSHNRGQGQDAIKMVNAWATETGMVIAQKDVPEDTNEIATVPKVLESLSLKGSLVTMDAANCQTGNTQIIADRGGDYVLSLKDNQHTLYVETMDTWTELMHSGFKGTKHETITTFDQAHGRKETRKYTLLTDFEHVDYLNRHGRWHKLASIGAVERTRQTADKVTQEVAFFLTSLKSDVERFAQAVRRHWSIENGLHWVMDVAFKEDQQRVSQKLCKRHGEYPP